MKLIPLSDRVLVKPEPESVFRGILIVPEVYRIPPEVGSVVAVGPDCCLDLRVGDRVVCDRYHGTDVRIDGEDVLLTPEDYIMATCDADDVVEVGRH